MQFSGINSIFPIERFLSISALARIRNKLMVFSTRGISLQEWISVAQQSNFVSNVHNLSANLVYTEPIEVNSMIQVFYNPSFTRNSADKRTFDLDSITHLYSDLDLPLTDSYEDDYFTQNAGIGYHWRKIFRHEPVHQRLVPDCTIAWVSRSDACHCRPDEEFFATVTRRACYFCTQCRIIEVYAFITETSTVAPSVTQLQQVIDNSNPLLLNTGNPDLVQSYSHTLLARYSSLTSSEHAQSMFLLLSGVYTAHYIANATIIPSKDTVLSNGTTLNVLGRSLPIRMNLDGYWNVRTFLTYGFPFDLLSSALNLNTGVTFHADSRHSERSSEHREYHCNQRRLCGWKQY